MCKWAHVINKYFQENATGAVQIDQNILHESFPL